jgi:hypothetical protein
LLTEILPSVEKRAIHVEDVLISPKTVSNFGRRYHLLRIAECLRNGLSEMLSKSLLDALGIVSFIRLISHS